MSSAVFPTLTGLGWNMKRTEMWKTRVQEAISGKEVRLADWTYPRHQWELTFEFLLQGTLNSRTLTDFATLSGFFNLRQGVYDSFLYTDPDDNTVTGQTIGTGDGSTTVFQLLRTFGSFIEPVLAPNTINAIKLNGVTQGGGSYSVSSTTGQITFNSAPGNGVAITADFTYYFRCRFVDDTMDFEKFMKQLYSTKSVKFISLKSG